MNFPDQVHGEWNRQKKKKEKNKNSFWRRFAKRDVVYWCSVCTAINSAYQPPPSRSVPWGRIGLLYLTVTVLESRDDRRSGVPASGGASAGARNARLYTNNRGLGSLEGGVEGFFCDLSVFSGLFSLSRRRRTLLTLWYRHVWVDHINHSTPPSLDLLFEHFLNLLFEICKMFKI